MFATLKYFVLFSSLVETFLELFIIPCDIFRVLGIVYIVDLNVEKEHNKSESVKDR